MDAFVSGGRSIRLDVAEPAPAGGEQPGYPAILLLHGAGGNSDFWFGRIAPFVSRLGIAVYGVHYFDRTGTVRADLTTITDGIHVPLWLSTVRDALAHISQRPGVNPTRLIVIGISLGAYLSTALATLPFRPAIRALIEVSGGLAPDYAGAVSEAFPPTLIAHGDQDTVVPVSEAHALKDVLDRHGIPAQLEVIPGEGHWFSQSAQLRILNTIGGFLNLHLQP